jgi:hypothetical protein
MDFQRLPWTSKDFRPIVKMKSIQFCAKHPHGGRNAMYSSSRKVEYNTDIILGRIVIVSKSYRVQRNKGAKCFVIADASTAFSLIIFVFCSSVYLFKVFLDYFIHGKV